MSYPESANSVQFQHPFSIPANGFIGSPIS
jgi:hypothetical protein